MNDSRPVRWGVMGAAMISRKFWQSVRLSGNSVLAAVASRSSQRGDSFVAECQQRFPVSQPPQVVGDYRRLLDSPDIDAVYIPLPTGLRRPWVEAAAGAGKHVLCEKPCAVSYEELESMVSACQKAGVQFMDNVMFMHSQRTDRFRELLQDQEKVGQVRRVATQFSFLGDSSFFQGDIRSQSQLEPMGCLGDLGWYTIRICLLAMGQQLPISVSGRRLDYDPAEAPPSEFCGDLVFPDHSTASMYCSFRNHHQQWVHVSGTRGNLWIEDFVLPIFGTRHDIRYRSPRFNETGFDFNYEVQGQDIWIDEHGNSHPNAPEVRLVRKFADLVLGGHPDPYWPTISLKTQRVMQALWDSSQAGGQSIEL